MESRISFIEKRPWCDETPFWKRTLIPVFMVRDGKEYFVMNREDVGNSDSYWARNTDEQLERMKAHLLETGGRYAKIHGIEPDPVQYVKWIRDNKRSVYKKELFVPCYHAGYGEGFTDFHGNGPDIGAFSYRIYCNELLDELKKLVKEIKRR